jgi:hypothetical protein
MEFIDDLVDEPVGFRESTSMAAWFMALTSPNLASNSFAIFIIDFLGMPRPITEAKSS